MKFVYNLFRYCWKLHLFTASKRQLQPLNIKSSGSDTLKAILHPTEEAAVDSKEAGLVSKHESTHRLLLLFMSTGDKEALGTLLSHFLSLHPELPVYCDAV